jgi:tripartite-type tricarboxylate transporter receptor subunit TctC
MAKIILRAVLSVALLANALNAAAQTYPTRPIRLVVPYPPGGATDPVARQMGQKLTDSMGQQVIVDNRPGGGTIIGTDLVAKALPDGYTMLLATSALAISPHLYKNLPYDAVRDFAPITLLCHLHFVLVVNPQLPVNSISGLVTYAKAQPGKLNYASTGAGTSPHLSMELFNSMAGTRMNHVPFKGSAPATISLLANESQVAVDSILLQLPHVKAGRLRALGLTGIQRTPLAPDIPTIAETGLAGFATDSWISFVAPAGTPKEIIKRLNSEFVKAVNTTEVRERLVNQGLGPIGSTPEHLGSFVKTEFAKWGKIAKDSGARID